MRGQKYLTSSNPYIQRDKSTKLLKIEEVFKLQNKYNSNAVFDFKCYTIISAVRNEETRY